MKSLCLFFCLLLAAALSQPAHAADTPKPVRVKPSKVSSAKSREREKQFSEWLKPDEFNKLVDAKRATGEQLIYMEYHEGKYATRGIFAKGLLFNGWYRSIIHSEKEMEKSVNDYKGRGFEPLFVVLEGNFYCAMYVKPEQLDAGRKLLLDLGVEPPVLK